MKVLYYPEITREDYERMIGRFAEEYRSFTTKNRYSYIPAVGATLLSWALAYSYRMKFSSFVALTVGSFALTKMSLGCLANQRMQHNLNGFAKGVAKDYNDIKYLKIDYTDSTQINKI
jgi:hypothetical protein